MADNIGKNDIDFDELDKAVSSLMGKVGDETLDDDVKTKTLEVATTLKPDDKVKYDEIGKVAQKIGDETLVTDGEIELVEDLSKLPEAMQLPVATAASTVATSPAPATTIPVTAPAKPAVPRPNSGRFMDMVHPKADMRTTPASAVTPTIAPIEDSVPIAASQATPVVAPEAAPPTPAPGTPTVTPEAPLTPFLPDAKVEKRPLGGGSSIAMPAISDGSLNVQPSESSQPVVNAVDPTAPKAATADNQLPPSPENNGDSLTEQALTKIEASEVGVTPVPVAPAVTGMPSIETVESGDTEGLKNGSVVEQNPTDAGGAIYDVNTYHQPLNHPAKRKSGWGPVIIIVIIIILAVVAAGGAYLYYFGQSS